jgi:hypothetical protein
MNRLIYRRDPSGYGYVPRRLPLLPTTVAVAFLFIAACNLSTILPSFNR